MNLIIQNTNISYKKFKIALYATFLAFFLIFAGCFGGGGIGSVANSDNLNFYYDSGWASYQAEDYYKSKVYFYRVLGENPPNDTKNEANLGLAWCFAREGKIDNAISFFEKITIPSNDYKVGYAGCLLKKGDSESIKSSIALLESIGAKEIKNIISSEHNLEYDSENVHAMLGLLYYLNGEKAKAVSLLSELSSSKLTSPYLNRKLSGFVEFIK